MNELTANQRKCTDAEIDFDDCAVRSDREVSVFALEPSGGGSRELAARPPSR